MHEPLALILAGLAGCLLGTLFFGGLWWTVRKGVSSKRPALWFSGSLLVRVSIALAGFYWVGRGRWERLLLCLLGFLIARTIVTLRVRSRLRPQAPQWQAGPARLARPPTEHPMGPAQEVRHAP